MLSFNCCTRHESVRCRVVWFLPLQGKGYTSTLGNVCLSKAYFYDECRNCNMIGIYKFYCRRPRKTFKNQEIGNQLFFKNIAYLRKNRLIQQTRRRQRLKVVPLGKYSTMNVLYYTPSPLFNSPEHKSFDITRCTSKNLHLNFCIG